MNFFLILNKKYKNEPQGALEKKKSLDKNLAPARPTEAKFLSGGHFFFRGGGAHFFNVFLIYLYIKNQKKVKKNNNKYGKFGNTFRVEGNMGPHGAQQLTPKTISR